jgi:hypothetical protein
MEQYAPWRKVSMLHAPPMTPMSLDFENRVVATILQDVNVPGYVSTHMSQVIDLCVTAIKQYLAKPEPGMEERVKEYVYLFADTGNIPYVASDIGARLPGDFLLDRPEDFPREPQMVERDAVLISIENPINPTGFAGPSVDRPNFEIFVAQPRDGARILPLAELITHSYNRPGPNMARAPALYSQTEFDEDTIRNMAKRYNANMALMDADFVPFEWVRVTPTDVEKTFVPVKLHLLSDDTLEPITPYKVMVDYRDGTSELKFKMSHIVQYYRQASARGDNIIVEPSLFFNLYTAPTSNHLDKIRLDIDPAQPLNGTESDPYAGAIVYNSADWDQLVAGTGIHIHQNMTYTRRVEEIINDGSELINSFVGT